MSTSHSARRQSRRRILIVDDHLPAVSCAAFAMYDGRPTEAMDVFAHPFWDEIRDPVSETAIGMRRQGCSGRRCCP
jgi:fructose 1,6-bisphosphate aldolase/phosphatase